MRMWEWVEAKSHEDCATKKCGRFSQFVSISLAPSSVEAINIDIINSFQLVLWVNGVSIGMFIASSEHLNESSSAPEVK